MPDESFFRLWTLKESFVKALGIGISYPLHTAVLPWTAKRSRRIRTAGSSGSSGWKAVMWSPAVSRPGIRSRHFRNISQYNAACGCRLCKKSPIAASLCRTPKIAKYAE
ncbi:MAG: 4'-phosphopantetheinyl transferase superfamily protein [Ruminococcus callidus]